VAAARAEAWEGQDPGGVRVLLSNPRWEKRLVKFLELCGVGRVMVDGVDEDEVRARRMDGRTVWEQRRGLWRVVEIVPLSFLSLC